MSGYSEGSGSLFSQTMGGFFSRSGTASEDIASRPVLVSRSRILDQSAPMARAAIDRITAGVCGGTGLEYAPTESTFFEPHVYEVICSQLKKALHLTSVSHGFDVQRRMTWPQMQRMACRNWLLSGDVFFVRRPGIYAAAWRALEGDRCFTPSFMALENLNGIVAKYKDHKVIDGVELDDDCRPVAYWFIKDPAKIDSGCENDFARIPAFDEFGLPLVLHIANLERPDQYRGIPLLSGVIESIYSTQNYSKAELQAAILESCLSLFVRTKTDPTQNPFGVGLDLDAPVVPEENSEHEREQSPDYRMVPDVNPEQFGVRSATAIGPGEMRHLAEGEDLVVVDPKRPASGYSAFLDTQNRQVAAAVGLPYNILNQTFDGMTYSSARASLVIANSVYKLWRGHFVECFMKPLFEVFAFDFLTSHIETMGPLIGEYDIRTAAKLIACESEWNSPQVLCLDPKAELDAASMAIDMGLIDRNEAARSIYGHGARGETKTDDARMQ